MLVLKTQGCLLACFLMCCVWTCRSIHLQSIETSVVSPTRWLLRTCFPNVEEVDLSYMNVSPVSFCGMFMACHRLERLTWKSSQRNVCLDGSSRGLRLSAFTELYLDSSQFEVWERDSKRKYSVEEYSVEDHYMLMYCRWLERLSIKNVTWVLNPGRLPTRQGADSQEMLIKMVRHHPTLRWLRSDLTEENTAMLKQERPEITLVSE